MTLQRENRFRELDAFRGIAAFIVMIYHYAERYHELYETNIERVFNFKYGYLGVELFFIISGFVIFFSLSRSDSPISFLKKRFVRLYPTYWVSIIITYVIVSWCGLPGRQVSISEFCVNFSMLQYGLKVPSVDGVYWSLFYELMFYFLMAASFRIIKSNKLYLFSSIWLLGFVISRIYTINYLSILLSLKFAPLFISGIYFYKILNEPKSYLNHIMVLLCLVCYLYFTEEFMERAIITFIYIGFYLFTHGKMLFVVNRPLLFLGSISYALYLVHQNIGYVVLNFLNENSITSQAILVVPILLSIALAYLITEYFEKPVTKYIKVKLKW